MSIILRLRVAGVDAFANGVEETVSEFHDRIFNNSDRRRHPKNLAYSLKKFHGGECSMRRAKDRQV
jgi:hypothetical protein